MRMRQSLSQMEREFEEEIARERQRRQMLRRAAKHRTRTRLRDRAAKHQNLRFAGLILAIVTTVVIVTVSMFQTLAWLMG